MRGRSTSTPIVSAKPAPVRDGRPSTSTPRADGAGADGGWGRDGGRRRGPAGRRLRPGPSPSPVARPPAFAAAGGGIGVDGPYLRTADAGSRGDTPEAPKPEASPRLGGSQPRRPGPTAFPAAATAVRGRDEPVVFPSVCVSLRVKSVPLKRAGCVSIYFFEVPVSGSETLPRTAAVAPRRIRRFSRENPRPFPAACTRGSAIARAALERIAS